MIEHLENRARAGVDVKVIGKMRRSVKGVEVRKMSPIRLHAQAIIRDGNADGGDAHRLSDGGGRVEHRARLPGDEGLLLLPLVRAQVLQGLYLRSAHQFDLIEFSQKKSLRYSAVE
jgi:hypothetical protein